MYQKIYNDVLEILWNLKKKKSERWFWNFYLINNFCLFTFFSEKNNGDIQSDYKIPILRATREYLSNMRAFREPLRIWISILDSKTVRPFVINNPTLSVPDAHFSTRSSAFASHRHDVRFIRFASGPFTEAIPSQRSLACFLLTKKSSFIFSLPCREIDDA